MVFKRVNKNTVNCIISPEDMSAKGLQIDDLFERKKETMEFLHMVVTQAEKELNFKVDGAFTSMKISVLADQSVSITLSEQQTDAFRAVTEEIAESKMKHVENSYLYGFETMHDVMRAIEHLSPMNGLSSSLYENQVSKSLTYRYYLILSSDQDMAAQDCQKSVLSVNEFGKFISGDEKIMAHIKEHAKCIQKEKAIENLLSLK